MDGLIILADAAKYCYAACTSSGLDRTSRPGGLGSPSWPDAATPSPPTGGASPCSRCSRPTAASTTAVLRSRRLPLGGFTPELCVYRSFYWRNYRDFFLSCAVGAPDHHRKLMTETFAREYNFGATSTPGFRGRPS